MNNLIRIKKFFTLIFTLTLISLIVTSCSSTRLAYNFVDVYLQWKIEDYVSLNSEQKKLTKQGLDEFHQWHRRTQLTRYSQYMDDLKGELNNANLSGEIIHKETDKLQLLLDDSINHLMPTLVELAYSLSDKQISEIESNLAKKRKKYLKEYVSIPQEKLYEKRIEDLREYMDPFFGGYTKQQKNTLNTWTRSVIDYEERMIIQQKNWSADLLNALNKKTTKEALHAQLKEIVLYRTDNWEAELNDILDKNQSMTYALVAGLVKGQTEKQRKKMNDKLDNYINDFKSLTK